MEGGRMKEGKKKKRKKKKIALEEKTEGEDISKKKQ